MRRRPADERRQRAGHGADERRERRPALHRRVDRQVDDERRERERAPRARWRERQQHEARDRERGAEQSRVARRRRGRRAADAVRVRRISASVSRSYTWFSTAAPPATSAVPADGCRHRQQRRRAGRAEVVARRAGRDDDEQVQPRLGERDVVGDQLSTRRATRARPAATSTRASFMRATRHCGSRIAGLRTDRGFGG